MNIRPQVLISVLLLGAIAVYSMSLGMNEIATGCVTLIGALSMKILEKE